MSEAAVKEKKKRHPWQIDDFPVDLRLALKIQAAEESERAGRVVSLKSILERYCRAGLEMDKQG